MSEEDPIVDGFPISQLRVVDLKEQLDKRGLDKKGNKKELTDRLRVFVLENESGGATKEGSGSPAKESPVNPVIAMYKERQQRLLAEAKEKKQHLAESGGEDQSSEASGVSERKEDEEETEVKTPGRGRGRPRSTSRKISESDQLKSPSRRVKRELREEKQQEQIIFEDEQDIADKAAGDAETAQQKPERADAGSDEKSSEVHVEPAVAVVAVKTETVERDAEPEEVAESEEDAEPETREEEMDTLEAVVKEEKEEREKSKSPEEREKSKSPEERERSKSPEEREKSKNPDEREKSESPEEREKSKNPDEREKSESPEQTARSKSANGVAHEKQESMEREASPEKEDRKRSLSSKRSDSRTSERAEESKSRSPAPTKPREVRSGSPEPGTGRTEERSSSRSQEADHKVSKNEASDHEELDYGEEGEGEDDDENKQDEVMEEEGVSVRRVILPEEEGFKRVKEVSPSRYPVSKLVHIRGLTRPFTVPQLHALIEKNGKIRDFWIDKIKSHCIVGLETVEEAECVRKAIHNVLWPLTNPKSLSAQFTTKDQFIKYSSGANPPPLVAAVAARPTAATPSRNGAPLSAKSTGLRITVETAVRDNQKKEAESARLRETRDERKRHRSATPPISGDLKKDRREEPLDRRIRDDKERPREDRLRRDDREKRSRDRDIRRDRFDDRVDRDRRYRREEEEKPPRALEELFKKTTAQPSIYWMPLSDKEVEKREADKAAALRAREEARERRDSHKEKERGERAKPDKEKEKSAAR